MSTVSDAGKLVRERSCRQVAVAKEQTRLTFLATARPAECLDD